jgi:hypothetical protein
VVTAILGVGDFFDALCLAGVPHRVSSAVALASSSIQVIEKESMIRMLRRMVGKPDVILGPATTSQLAPNPDKLTGN